MVKIIIQLDEHAGKGVAIKIKSPPSPLASKGEIIVGQRLITALDRLVSEGNNVTYLERRKSPIDSPPPPQDPPAVDPRSNGEL